MNKTDLVNRLSTRCNITKHLAAMAIDETVDSITSALKKGDRVQLVGFGTFSVSKRKARNGRNPQTGDVIKIAAHRAAKFSAGSELKTMLNGKKLKTHTTGTTMPSYGDPTTE